MNVLITGASSGFGKLTTEILLKNGHKVAATMRDPSGRNKVPADELKNAGAVITEIDVTNEESVKKGVGEAIETLSGLDVVINNAGFGVVGVD